MQEGKIDPGHQSATLSGKFESADENMMQPLYKKQ